ncbi:MAG: hypothetical protein ACM3L6_05840, partial [Deltaproteobacteria bacterium]
GVENKELIERIRRIKREKGYTLHDLSVKLDVQIATIERWLKTGRINRVYACWIEQKLHSLGSGAKKEKRNKCDRRIL